MLGFGWQRRDVQQGGASAGAAGEGLQVVEHASAIVGSPGEAEPGAGMGDQAECQPVPEAVMKFARSAAKPPT